VINVAKGFGESAIKIIDVNGRIVFEQDILLNSSYSINTQNLKTGIYLLQIMTKNGNSFITKIAIQ